MAAFAGDCGSPLPDSDGRTASMESLMSIAKSTASLTDLKPYVI